MVIHGQQAELGISAPIKTNSRLNTMARVVDMSDKQAISELGNHSSLLSYQHSASAAPSVGSTTKRLEASGTIRVDFSCAGSEAMHAAC